jgi:hypothetical protein
MVKTYDCTSGGAQWCQGCYTMTEQPDFLGKRQGEWVSLEDYEKLEAALELISENAEASGSPLLERIVKIQEVSRAALTALETKGDAG